MQIFRCALRRRPSSSLANDCITAMAEGLSSNFYSHFLSLLWKDGDSAYLSEADNGVNLEWDSFCSIILQMCRSSTSTQKHSNPTAHSSWEFLINSKFHKNFCKHSRVTRVASVISLDMQKLDSFESNLNTVEKIEKSFYSELMMESLDCLHAVYESLKLDTLRKRYALFSPSLPSLILFLNLFLNNNVSVKNHNYFF